MNDPQIEALFRAWWAQSWPTPPGNHALQTHTAFARFLLEHIGHLQQQREQSR